MTKNNSMNVIKKIKKISLVVVVFLATKSLQSMHELSCCEKMTDSVIKFFEDPSLAHDYMNTLQHDLKTYTAIHKDNPSKYNSQNIAYIMWQRSRFEKLSSTYSCQMSKKIIIEEMIHGNHRADEFVKKLIWDKTTNGDYVACPYKKNN
ncbi:hypothetical protein [Candidatus Chromulinivorax destructor]|uniref:Uncharacterized protein n=1 Tax=Candidatus Chromulinivorax destructor TaxID=2066483 RepID=A0A345ZAL3_9BACT|nr:hypothetical protein [Candidatus Chromulinivorax destructor]AXK60330.1 hypothetical protein C0J27_01015 [Candidatus Chromulinivorax destructor]